MNLETKNNARSIFVDTHSEPEMIRENEQVNVILSPSFYWVKRVNLPVENLRKVKKLLPAIFEENLPKDSSGYSYSAYLDGEEFIVFAYESREIIKAISNVGIKTRQTKAIYFAQSEFAQIEAPIKINGHSLAIKDGIVVKVPSSIVNGKEVLDLSGHIPSKNPIRVERFSYTIDAKLVAPHTLFLALLVALFLVEPYIYLQRANEVSAKEEELTSKYSLLPTMIQNQSVLKGLRGSLNRQNSLRKVLNVLTKERLREGETLKIFKYKNEKSEATYEVGTEARSNEIVSKLKKEGLNVKNRFKNGLLHIEISL